MFVGIETLNFISILIVIALIIIQLMYGSYFVIILQLVVLVRLFSGQESIYTVLDHFNKLAVQSYSKIQIPTVNTTIAA